MSETLSVVWLWYLLIGPWVIFGLTMYYYRRWWLEEVTDNKVLSAKYEEVLNEVVQLHGVISACSTLVLAYRTGVPLPPECVEAMEQYWNARQEEACRDAV